MDMERANRFAERWAKYFPGAELPIAFYYSNDENAAPAAPESTGWQCLMGNLVRVRRGESRRFDVAAIGCEGGKRYSGFKTGLRPNFEYFLSCGIKGVVEGERYKKSPELVLEFLKNSPLFEAPAKYIVFKRWDKLEPGDDPAVVIFFATPDVLSGLFTLAGFDESDSQATVAPFGAGCGTVLMYPYLEQGKERPRAVLGMFDVSARPFVDKNVLSFSVPMKKFDRMLDNMDESFLITESWARVTRRM